MSEQLSECGPVATRMIFDNDDVGVWEMKERGAPMVP
jgi:hypothetical protein